MKPRHLDLFSGFGPVAYAFQDAGCETIGLSEICPDASAILATLYPHIPNYGDIRNISYIPNLSVISGGDPCQGNSTAGRGLGKLDPRYLWPEMFRVIAINRPKMVFNENVPGSISNGVLDQKISDLESIGYTSQVFSVPASALGADHERERVYVLAADFSRIGQSRQGTPGKSVHPAQNPYREASGFVHAVQGRTVSYVCGSHARVSVKASRAINKCYGNSVSYPVVRTFAGVVAGMLAD